MSEYPSMILVTGAAGYIGSHVLLSLIQQGHSVVALDNLAQSSGRNLEAVQTLTGETFPFVQGDIRDSNILNELFQHYPIDAVIHLAGLKVISDSFSDPLAYYDNNVTGTQTLLNVMAQHGVYRLIFSSSAAVYGPPSRPPFNEEETHLQPETPYGRSKLMAETMLSDLARSDVRWCIGILRYFNPIGSHESALLGESSRDRSGDLVSELCKAASCSSSALTVFGADYPTHDGTGIRDYLHICDLAEGHLLALKYCTDRTGCNLWNLGSGTGYTVLDIINCFEQVTGLRVPYRISSNRPGDVAASWTSTSKSLKDLGWKAQRPLATMLADSWNRYQYLENKCDRGMV